MRPFSVSDIFVRRSMSVLGERWPFLDALPGDTARNAIFRSFPGLSNAKSPVAARLPGNRLREHKRAGAAGQRVLPVPVGLCESSFARPLCKRRLEFFHAMCPEPIFSSGAGGLPGKAGEATWKEQLYRDNTQGLQAVQTASAVCPAGRGRGKTERVEAANKFDIAKMQREAA